MSGMVAWGTVPDVVTAAATTIAATWGIYLFGVTVYRRRRDVARNVYCYLSLETTESEVVITNNSRSPVFRISTFARYDHMAEEIGSCIEVIRSGCEKRIKLPRPLDRPSASRIEIVFTDNIGNQWRRRGDGSIKAVTRFYRRR